MSPPNRRMQPTAASEVLADQQTRDARADPMDVRNNDVRGARLFAIIMDDALTPLDPFVARTARNSALAFVRGLRPGDLVTIVYTWDVQKGQEFTTNRTQIESAIQRFRPGPGVKSPLAPIHASRTIGGVVAAMHALPAHQRSIVLISPGVRLATNGSVAAMGSFDADADIDWRFEATDVLRAFSGQHQARVPIYAVDVMGLVAPTDAGRSATLASLSARSPGSDWLKNIADASGGYAITNTNDPISAIRSVLRESDAYYVLGLRAPSVMRSHRIHLRLRDRRGGTAVIRQ